MNKEYKQPWIDALRSGNFKQGRNKLESQGKYCCLGVLCEVMQIPKIEKDEEALVSVGVKKAKPYSEYEYEGDKFKEYFPEGLRNKVSLSCEDMDYLVEMNDESKCSFEHIAEYIEDNF